jgi:glucose-1-phosphate thymidylyltransferase
MKGIVLAGGTGSRLWPLTKSVSKQLLPVYDKPMIYYPISTLMLAGVREILIITTPGDQSAFQNLLGDGSKFGISLTYEIQPEPKGLAQAFTIGKDFIGSKSCLMILGDNIFFGSGLGQHLSKSLPKSGAHVFTYEVADPSVYGVLELDENGSPKSITEKPKTYVSSNAVTGLYYFDRRVTDIAAGVKPSNRGELEITSVIEHYLKSGELTYTHLNRGIAWLDTGNPDALHSASSFVKVIEERTGLKIGCIEEVAYQNGWMTQGDLVLRAKELGKNPYSEYLAKLAG